MPANSEVFIVRIDVLICLDFVIIEIVVIVILIEIIIIKVVIILIFEEIRLVIIKIIAWATHNAPRLRFLGIYGPRLDSGGFSIGRKNRGGT